MSTDFSIRPVGAPSPTPVLQPQSKAADVAVATELPPRQTVNVADASAGARNDPGPASDSTSRQVIFDREAASIVFQVLDSRTESVLQQYPDEAALRRRAYFRNLDLAKSDPPRVVATDRKA